VFPKRGTEALPEALPEAMSSVYERSDHLSSLGVRYGTRWYGRRVLSSQVMCQRLGETRTQGHVHHEALQPPQIIGLLQDTSTRLANDRLPSGLVDVSGLAVQLGEALFRDLSLLQICDLGHSRRYEQLAVHLVEVQIAARLLVSGVALVIQDRPAAAIVLRGIEACGGQ